MGHRPTRSYKRWYYCDVDVACVPVVGVRCARNVALAASTVRASDMPCVHILALMAARIALNIVACVCVFVANCVVKCVHERVSAINKRMCFAMIKAATVCIVTEACVIGYNFGYSVE